MVQGYYDEKESNIKTIMVTGASGFLANQIISKIINNKNYEVIALSSKKEGLIKQYSQNKNIECFNIGDMKSNEIPFERVDTLIHCAFARGHKSGADIANSLSFTNEIFQEAANKGVKSIINISTQGVYGHLGSNTCSEATQVSPTSLYGIAKYATEVMSLGIKNDYNINVTNIRLASLSGGSKGLTPEVISKFVKKTLDSEKIVIVGGKQVFSYMDVRDAASAIVTLLGSNPLNWKPTYNLGNNKYYNIIDIANDVIDISKDYVSYEVKVEIQEKDIILNVGMDSSLFYRDFNWKPNHDIRSLIRSIFLYYLNTYREKENV